MNYQQARISDLFDIKKLGHKAVQRVIRILKILVKMSHRHFLQYKIKELP